MKKTILMILIQISGTVLKAQKPEFIESFIEK
jgi:hypothetical protein